MTKQADEHGFTWSLGEPEIDGLHISPEEQDAIITKANAELDAEAQAPANRRVVALRFGRPVYLDDIEPDEPF